jgi:hypothetical protein
VKIPDTEIFTTGGLQRTVQEIPGRNFPQQGDCVTAQAQHVALRDIKYRRSHYERIIMREISRSGLTLLLSMITIVVPHIRTRAGERGVGVSSYNDQPFGETPRGEAYGGGITEEPSYL